MIIVRTLFDILPRLPGLAKHSFGIPFEVDVVTPRTIPKSKRCQEWSAMRVNAGCADATLTLTVEAELSEQVDYGSESTMPNVAAGW